MSAPTRSPVLGYNHNIRHRGIVFHVQTEDSGVENPHIYTHIFQGGVILASRKLDYDGEASEETVKALMQAQHKAVLKDLKRGAFNEKIEAYFGDQVDDSEASGEPTATTAPDAAPARPPRASTDEDARPAGADAEAAEAASGADAGAVPEASEEPADATIPMERPSDDVAAALDAVHDESTSPATEVKVTWRKPPPPPPRGSGGRRPTRESGAPRVPHPDDSPGSYRARRPSRDVVPSPLAEATRAAAASSGGAEAPKGERTRPPSDRAGAPAPGAGGRDSSPVVVSRPSVIVGGPAGAKSAPPRSGGESKPAAGEARRRERPDKRRREGLFGQDLISEKSLDEVILAYLSEDSGDE